MPAMLRPIFSAVLVALAMAAAPAASVISTPLAAQTAEATPTPQHPTAAAAAGESTDFITPHITDSHFLDLPYWHAPFYVEVELPRWKPFEVAGIEVDMSPTKHVVFMIAAALIAIVLLVGAAQSSKAGHKMIGRPKGFASAIEALALNLRNEVILPNVGEHGQKFVPFCLTLFFFILFCNLLGLIPYGATATGNISVTATLAIVTLVVVELTGIFTLGVGYLGTLFYWNKELPMAVRIPMFFIMSPIEMIGKLTKPFALTIRLFANMTAGHIVLLALIGLIFTFGSYWVAAAPVLMASAISVLELFVSFLQAFIFTLLAAVFIGQMRQSHH